MVLQREPQCNVSFQGDVMHQYTRQDISVAVAAPTGLITPIIRDAGRKGLAEISTEMKDLATRAKDGKLAPDEYQGGTASLSNMGMFGVSHFGAILPEGQGCILAIGATQEVIVPDDAAVLGMKKVKKMSVTLTCDHRQIYGSDAAFFLKTLANVMENQLDKL